MTGASGVEVRGVTKTYGDGPTAYQALRGVDFSARPGEVVILSGPSGSGKTTLLSIVGCVLSASSGSVEARASLERLHVKSPIDATVLQLKTRIGEYYNTQGTDPLLVVGDVRVLKVRMDVDERDVAKVQLGASAYVTLNADPAKHIAGKVVEIGRHMGRKNVRTDDPVERNDTKILEVVLELTERDVALVPGIRVTAYVHTQPRVSAVTGGST